MKGKNGKTLGKSRETFGSSMGLLAAAVGSAVGLGNIWRFPTITGQNGGGSLSNCLPSNGCNHRYTNNDS